MTKERCVIVCSSVIICMTTLTSCFSFMRSSRIYIGDNRYGSITTNVGQPVPGHVFLDSWRSRHKWAKNKLDVYAPTVQGTVFSSETSYLGLNANIQADPTVIDRYRAVQNLATHELEREDEIGDAYKEYKKNYIETQTAAELIRLGTEKQKADYFESVWKAQAGGYTKLIEAMNQSIQNYNDEIARLTKELEDELSTEVINKIEKEVAAQKEKRGNLLSQYQTIITAVGIAKPSSPDPSIQDIEYPRSGLFTHGDETINVPAGGKVVKKEKDGTEVVYSRESGSGYVAKSTSAPDISKTTAANLTEINKAINQAAATNISDKDLAFIKFLADREKPESTPIEKVKSEKAYRDYLNNLMHKSQFSGLINYGGHTIFNIPVNLTVTPQIQTAEPAVANFTLKLHESDRDFLSKSIPSILRKKFHENRKAIFNEIIQGKIENSKYSTGAQAGFGHLWSIYDQGVEQRDSSGGHLPGSKTGKILLTELGKSLKFQKSAKFMSNGHFVLTDGWNMAVQGRFRDIELKRDSVSSWSTLVSPPDFTIKIEPNLEKAQKGLGLLSEMAQKVLDLKTYLNGVRTAMVKNKKLNDIDNAIKELEEEKARISDYTLYLKELVSTLGAMPHNVAGLSLVESVKIDEKGAGELVIGEHAVIDLVYDSISVLSVDPDEVVEEIDDLKQIKKALNIGAQATALAGNVGLALGFEYLSSKLNASAFRKRIVTLIGTSHDPSDKGAAPGFGWIFLPAPQGADDDYDIQLVMEPNRVAANVLIKVPSWLDRLVVKQTTVWGEGENSSSREKVIYLNDPRANSGFSEFSETILGMGSSSGMSSEDFCAKLRETPGLSGTFFGGSYDFILSGKSLDQVVWVKLGDRRTSDLYHLSPNILTGTITDIDSSQCLPPDNPCDLLAITESDICIVKKGIFQQTPKLKPDEPQGHMKIMSNPRIVSNRKYTILIANIPSDRKPNTVVIGNTASPIIADDELVAGQGPVSILIKSLSENDTKELRCDKAWVKQCEIQVLISLTNPLEYLQIGKLELSLP